MKREGVDRLARIASGDALVLDLGSGAGAYALWFLSRCPATVVSVDWSLLALRRAPLPVRGRLLRVCADVSMLPFRSRVFSAAFSVDTFGHVEHLGRALDELGRVCRCGVPLFLHSECADYRSRWPDRALIAELGEDRPALADGHVGLRRSTDLRKAYTARFMLLTFESPAGLLGWLIGHPEKYAPAFRAASHRLPAAVTGMMGLARAAPVLGWGLRIVNALTNRLELFLGISGGGSCFAVLRTFDSPGKGLTDDS